MAGMGKVKALQIWCKNRVMGYKDVEITNMTTSWRDGLAFCALIHKFRPDLIDFESLSKENVLENNELAFEVAEGLGVPALLDAEDMVRLETPDKLSIITYVAQLHNCFKEMEPAGGPGVKTAAPKRHSTPVHRSVTMRSPESKRKPVLSANKKEDSGSLSSGGDICEACDGKVYIIEKHMADGKLYHRSCYKRSSRPERPSSALVSSQQAPSAPSTPLRPVSLVSNGLKKPSTSLPSTPSTPPDPRPEWQRKLLEKSANRRNIVGATNRASALDPVNENSSSVKGGLSGAATKLPKTEAERVQLRSKPVDSLKKNPLPRAVSVGVDLDERISKLRQLRESAKASGGNPAVRAKLEKLRERTLAGSSKLASTDSTDNTSKSGTNSTNSTSMNSTANATSETISSTTTESDSASITRVTSSTESSSQSTASENQEEAEEVGVQDVEVRESPTKSEKEARHADSSNSNDSVIESSTSVQLSSQNTNDDVTSEDVKQPHSSSVSISVTGSIHQESAVLAADSNLVSDISLERQTAGEPKASLESAAAKVDRIPSVPASKHSTNPFEDDDEEESQPALSQAADTVQLRVSSPPQAPARHKRSPVAKSKAHSPSAATSSPSSKLTGSTPVTDDTILPAKSAQSSLNVTVSSHLVNIPPSAAAAASKSVDAVTMGDEAEDAEALNDLEEATRTGEFGGNFRKEESGEESGKSDDDITDPTCKEDADWSTTKPVASAEDINDQVVSPNTDCAEDVNARVTAEQVLVEASTSATEEVVETAEDVKVVSDDSEPAASPDPEVRVAAEEPQVESREGSEGHGEGTTEKVPEAEEPQAESREGSEGHGEGTTEKVPEAEEPQAESKEGSEGNGEETVEKVPEVVEPEANESESVNNPEASVDMKVEMEERKESTEAGAVEDSLSDSAPEDVIISAADAGKDRKPERPPVSPAVTKRWNNNDVSKAGNGVLSSPEPSAVVMRQRENKSKVSQRAVTAVHDSKSNFHESHEDMIPPPPKPARQSAIVTAGPEAKNSWENALESWSDKRKEQRSTWYKTETYPAEHNPFGDDEDAEEEQEVRGDNQKNSDYDESLNPFADDLDESEKVELSDQQPNIDTNTETPLRKKIIPSNPFESSDEDDVPSLDNRKIIPEQIPAVKSKDTPTTKRLSETGSKRATPKKKAAPPPPQTPPTSTQTPPTSTQTPPTSTQTQPLDSTTAQTKQPDKSAEIFITEPEINEDAKSADVQKKKHRPAPPRPLPPKRRVQSEYGLQPEDIDRELASLDVKQQELEDRGRQLEQAIRTAEKAAADTNDSLSENDELLSSWLETINEKNQLVRRESELIFISKHHDLEMKQADIEYELRQIMHRAEKLKSDADKIREDELLTELVSVVHERSQLVDKMDDERIRQQQEDQEIYEALNSKFDGEKPASKKSPEVKKSNKKTKKKKDKK